MDISRLTDDELWRRTKELAQDERAALCDVLEHLAEIERRRLSVKRGRGTLFEYCVHYLRYSEAAAYRRIRAVRAIEALPAIKDLLRDGRLTLESIALLHPHLDEPDATSLVHQAAGLRTWEVQALLANRQVERPRRDVIRYVGPAPTAPTPQQSTPDEPTLLTWTAPSMPSASRPEAISPAPPPIPPAAPSKAAVSVSPSIRVAFTADADFHGLLRRAQALLRHKYPDGKLEGVLRDALIALLKRKDPGIRWAPAKGALARRP